jgi:DNA adenine methylase
LEKARGDSLITYDNDGYVRELSERHGFKTVEVAMQNTHLAKMNELLIGRDLGWLAGDWTRLNP